MASIHLTADVAALAANWLAQAVQLVGGKVIEHFEHDDDPNSPTFGQAHAKVRDPMGDDGTRMVPIGNVGPAFPPLHVDGKVDNGDAPAKLKAAKKSSKVTKARAKS